jgi:hypothetical protein
MNGALASHENPDGERPDGKRIVTMRAGPVLRQPGRNQGIGSGISAAGMTRLPHAM